jgi:SpoVK/Ycf46/Vps4 family AAA+-type ATPase
LQKLAIDIMISNFSIIQSLCRSALSSSREMTEHQVVRLIDSYKKNGQDKEAKSLEGILISSQRTEQIKPLDFVVSSLEGETLTKNVAVPVDKETSTPILEVIFPDEVDCEMPVFNSTVQQAVDAIITEWENYDRLIQLDASPSRSCLIFGDPGTGKTMLAKWIAKSVGLPLVLAKLDGIISSFLGTSSRNIANLFRFANKYKCILLLDEFDALAKLRDDPQEIGEVKRIVNTLLQNLDIRSKIGFTIGITNHEKLLDPAVWRRFDVQIVLPHPNPDVRIKILEKYIHPLEYSLSELKFINWCMKDSTGADVRKLSDWMKRSSILDEGDKYTIIDLMRQFSTMNVGRISSEISSQLNGNLADLCCNLINDKTLDLRQKDLAELFGISQSALSKLISKQNSNGRKQDSDCN